MQYYQEMLFEIMKNEKSYDILPNFTAVDVNIQMGIGRNQYIDLMNKARSKVNFIFIKKFRLGHGKLVEDILRICYHQNHFLCLLDIGG